MGALRKSVLFYKTDDDLPSYMKPAARLKRRLGMPEAQTVGELLETAAALRDSSPQGLFVPLDEQMRENARRITADRTSRQLINDGGFWVRWETLDAADPYSRVKMSIELDFEPGDSDILGYPREPEPTGDYEWSRAED